MSTSSEAEERSTWSYLVEIHPGYWLFRFPNGYEALVDKVEDQGRVCYDLALFQWGENDQNERVRIIEGRDYSGLQRVLGYPRDRLYSAEQAAEFIIKMRSLPDPREM